MKKYWAPYQIFRKYNLQLLTTRFSASIKSSGLISIYIELLTAQFLTRMHFFHVPNPTFQTEKKYNIFLSILWKVKKMEDRWKFLFRLRRNFSGEIVAIASPQCEWIFLPFVRNYETFNQTFLLVTVGTRKKKEIRERQKNWWNRTEQLFFVSSVSSQFRTIISHVTGKQVGRMQRKSTVFAERKTFTRFLVVQRYTL